MKPKLIAGLLAVLLGGFFVSAQAQSPSIFQADARVNVKSIQVVNTVSPTVVSINGATLYGIEAYNNSTTIAYVKLYNAPTATCGSGTPQARYMIPASTSFPLLTNNTNGDAYGAGITVCVTTGYADSDTGAPAATEYIVNIHYK